jgi:hypothetical protein
MELSVGPRGVLARTQGFDSLPNVLDRDFSSLVGDLNEFH